jgi:phosphatidylglycerophosphate synthase
MFYTFGDIHFPRRLRVRFIDLEKVYVHAMDTTPFVAQHSASSAATLRQTAQKIELATVVSTGIVIWRTYGLRSTVRYLAGLTLALTAQRTFLSAMMRKTGAQQASLADVLTLSRAATGAVLAGLVASGIRDRTGMAGRLSWSMLLLGVTALDWLDGPLARHAGATRLGSVLDIEADSWLTLWSAACATAWGDLPRWCLLPPILRYLDPLLDLRRGKLPRGGGPWWSRLTGTGQMVLFLTALAPVDGRWRKQALAVAALPVSGGQSVAVIVLLARKRQENAGALHKQSAGPQHPHSS